MPMYGLEACRSLDFVVNSFNKIIFKTNNMQIVMTYQEQFRFRLLNDLQMVTSARSNMNLANSFDCNLFKLCRLFKVVMFTVSVYCILLPFFW